MKIIKSLTITFLLTVFFQVQSWAQCAMCRATVENNLNTGETSVGAGLNTGIMYLFMMPYLIAMVIGYLWYKKAKKRKSKFVFQGEKF
ncbi:MAG: hypothetical protein EA341_06355 [Mongoliibacter sp.]|jgi:hypothetical protein|uniref:hypothetical protein n=1 Tax=Mongoliibacter sp. TaxID=2022438 RepID=UPI0012EFC4CD|nr:hypothetical protein [Mongoliibacter sp.]TVP50991.1 MAG: hypothetical protein EA341_06355 [Mongoliibacter sp.]